LKALGRDALWSNIPSASFTGMERSGRIGQLGYTTCDRTLTLELSRLNDAARAFYHRQGYSEPSRYELLDKAL
jgi:hypothetical protein